MMKIQKTILFFFMIISCNSSAFFMHGNQDLEQAYKVAMEALAAQYNETGSIQDMTDYSRSIKAAYAENNKLFPSTLDEWVGHYVTLAQALSVKIFNEEELPERFFTFCKMLAAASIFNAVYDLRAVFSDTKRQEAERGRNTLLTVLDIKKCSSNFLERIHKQQCNSELLTRYEEALSSLQQVETSYVKKISCSAYQFLGPMTPEFTLRTLSEAYAHWLLAIKKEKQKTHQEITTAGSVTAHYTLCETLCTVVRGNHNEVPSQEIIIKEMKNDFVNESLNSLMFLAGLSACSEVLAQTIQVMALDSIYCQSGTKRATENLELLIENPFACIT